MRCTEVEKLLPLYVGDDLRKAREATKVGEHLASCAACRLKAEEFEASRSLLALHAPPVFDEAFFAGVRRNVMRGIEDEKRRPAPFASLRHLFAPRTAAVAAAFALLVACALVAFQLYRRAVPQPTAAAETAATTPTTMTNTRGESPSSEKTSETHAPVAAQHGEPRQQQPQQVAASSRPARIARRGASSQTQTVARRGASPIAPSSTNEVGQTPEPETVAAVNHSASPTEVVERKLTRIELQTGDPNVRIIWLSPGVDDKPAIQRETKR